MSRKEVDFKDFARLHGIQPQKGWFFWGEIFTLALFLAGVILLITNKLEAAIL